MTAEQLRPGRRPLPRHRLEALARVVSRPFNAARALEFLRVTLAESGSGRAPSA